MTSEQVLTYLKRRISSGITLLVLLLWGGGSLSAQVTGTVFRDYDGDGLKGSAEPLVAGVTVNVYNTAGTLCGTTATTSASAPNYSVSGCSGSVRVEFVVPNTGSCLLDPDIDFTSTGGECIWFLCSVCDKHVIQRKFCY